MAVDLDRALRGGVLLLAVRPAAEWGPDGPPAAVDAARSAPGGRDRPAAGDRLAREEAAGGRGLSGLERRRDHDPHDLAARGLVQLSAGLVSGTVVRSRDKAADGIDVMANAA